MRFDGLLAFAVGVWGLVPFAPIHFSYPQEFPTPNVKNEPQPINIAVLSKNIFEGKPLLSYYK